MQSTFNTNDVLSLYKAGKSTHEIAKQLKTYPNRIRRILLKAGAKLRTRSVAQKQALDSGRHIHPTKGKHRSEETKLKIAKGVHNYWEGMSEDEYAARVAMQQKIWENLSEADKNELRALASEAVRKAAKNGSKIELFVRKYLTDKGFDVILKKSGIVSDASLEVDLLVPGLKTAIEIDGPSHFFPIWGADNLQRHIRADAKKSGLLLSAGFCLIRVKHISKHVSDIQMRDVAEAIEAKLREIEKQFPPQSKRFFELEV